MNADGGVIIGLGEILWDLLPGGRQLGGAPFNFAFHCHQLGHASVMVSRVGTDAMGDDIRAAVQDLGLTDAFLQRDESHPTGTVTVAVEQGQPTYIITPEVAYDYLAWDEELERLCDRARAVCFGTLVQRHDVARHTVRHAVARIARRGVVVYDVNLRQHYFSREVIEASLYASHWAKLNADELGVLRDLLSLRGKSDVALLADLRRRYWLEVAILTRGAHGCLVQTDTEDVEVPGLPVTVVDTVGAGDAFTAGLLVSVLEGKSIRQAAGFANRLAARVAGSAGGTPAIDRAEVEV